MKLRASTLAFAALFIGGCGLIESVFGDGSDDGAGPPEVTPPFGTLDGGSAEASKPCTGLCLQQVQCGNGATTSLSGTVKDPAGKNPLYNILVYVPNAPVQPMSSGASCDRCGSVSGDPLVTAITDAAGRFKLENVPVGDDIPLVVQVGKWRRRLTIPKVAQCVDTPLADDVIRLPKNKQEGDIPQIALTTGGADVMECLLRKVGLDDSEFTTNTGAGRVHFYQGSPSSNQTTRVFDAAHGGATFPSATAFWDSAANLLKYDIVILSCEGATYPTTKPTSSLKALYDYAGQGGRVFASHWHRYWFNTSAMIGGNNQVVQPAGPQPSPFETIGSWADRNDPPQPAYGTVDTSFPKGKAMFDWLGNVSALTGGKLEINEARHNIDNVSTNATSWISLANPNASNQNTVQYLSFNTPIPAADDQKCGRVVYSDLHVSSGDARGVPWPTGCQSTDLSDQEKALEFMLFDLSSCIQSDKEAPTAPPVVK